MAAQKVLYIKGDRDVEVTEPKVVLSDILMMECTDKVLLQKLKALKILRFHKSGRQRQVISVLKVIEMIHGICPETDVRNLGETDIIVTYEDQKTPAFAWHILKTAFVVLITFFGAAFSIMAFNNDVDVSKLFDQVYELVTGQTSDGYTILEISYSVGVTAGILIFFNHFGRKRFSVDPTPMEIQMRLYENDIQTTLIENSERKGEEIDVDTADSSGTHRT
nr:stage V sporulation protein AA [uncultured Mediterraneibacter sp.]